MDIGGGWIDAWNSGAVAKTRFLSISGMRLASSIPSRFPGTGAPMDISSYLPGGCLLATTEERDDQGRWTRMGVHVLKCVRDTQGNVTDIKKSASLQKSLGQDRGERRHWLVDSGAGHVISAGYWGPSTFVLTLVNDHSGSIVGIAPLPFDSTAFQEWATGACERRGGYLIVDDESGSLRTRVLQLRRREGGSVRDILSITPKILGANCLLALGDDHFVVSTGEGLRALKFVAQNGEARFLEVASSSALGQACTGSLRRLCGDYLISASRDNAESVSVNVLKVVRDSSGDFSGIVPVCSCLASHRASHVELLPLGDRHVLLFTGDQRTGVVKGQILKVEWNAKGAITAIRKEWRPWRRLSVTFRGLLHSTLDLGGGQILVSVVDRENDGTFHVLRIDGRSDHETGGITPL